VGEHREGGALEHVLRTLNVDDHLRGVQPYDEDARLIALWALLVDAYATDKQLTPALSETFPDAHGATQLDVDGVRAALTANGPLTALAPLLPLEEQATPTALRDIAIRAITALVFPAVPEAPANVVPLSADQRIEWMEKLTKARSAAESSVSAVRQFEKLILGL
jgi:hypothetical protein